MQCQPQQMQEKGHMLITIPYYSFIVSNGSA